MNAMTECDCSISFSYGFSNQGIYPNQSNLERNVKGDANKVQLSIMSSSKEETRKVS